MHHITTFFLGWTPNGFHLNKYEKVKKKKENSLSRVLDLVFSLINTLYL